VRELFVTRAGTADAVKAAVERFTSHESNLPRAS
jgi:hypothetical protein